MKSLTAALIAEKNKMDTASAWLILLQVQVGPSSWEYLTPNPTAITFNSIVYDPFPCSIETMSSDTKGTLSDLNVAVSNVTREISGFLEVNDMRGMTVKTIIVNTANLADPTSKIEEEFEITEITVTEEAVVFRLGHVRILNQIFPNGRFFRNNCRWIYKSAECGYSGGIATCSKVLEGSNGCRAHANQARFGGFPGIPSIRR